MAKWLRDKEEQTANTGASRSILQTMGAESHWGLWSQCGTGISRYPTCEVGVPTGLWWRDANPGTSGLLHTREE